MFAVTRREIWQTIPVLLPITFGSIILANILVTLTLINVGFHGAQLHYVLATVLPMIMTPAAAIPLVIMSQRLQRMKVELEGLLRVDGLTSIPNRRAFFESAARVFSHKSGATAMMIDIDHFKKVNDRYGHAVGDVVLSTVGHMIDRTVAAANTGGARIAARIGGEEFAVLVENLGESASADLAQAILEHIRATPIVAGDHTILVTVSIGFAQRHTESTPDELLRLADLACYRAKRRGRNGWCSAAEHPGRLRPETKAIHHVCQRVA